MRQGFTLVELLVVITIIVVLLALLTPALDRAIYQAELVVCGSNLSAISRGTTVYAAENKRRYIYRPTAAGPNSVPNRIYSPDAMGFFGPRVDHLDDRPYIEQHININTMLHCPLSEFTDLIFDNDPDSWLLSSYQLYFSWQFRYPATGGSGMFKIGDRLGYDGDRFTTIASDRDVYDQGQLHASHPDDDGHLSLSKYKNQDYVTYLAKVTWNTWNNRNPDGWERGLMDRNFAHTDGSVQRLNDLTTRAEPPGTGFDADERLTLIPEYNDALEFSNREAQPRG